MVVFGNAQAKHVIPFEKYDDNCMISLELNVHSNALIPEGDQVALENKVFVEGYSRNMTLMMTS
jgi:hypothetical protein